MPDNLYQPPRERPNWWWAIAILFALSLLLALSFAGFDLIESLSVRNP
jgi:hypothetical protein